MFEVATSSATSFPTRQVLVASRVYSSSSIGTLTAKLLQVVDVVKTQQHEAITQMKQRLVAQGTQKPRQWNRDQKPAGGQ